jgi:hypothetical protein
MIIECPYCESKVDGKVFGEHITSKEDYPFPTKVVLLECPACKESLVGYQELVETAYGTDEWVSGNRLWPEPVNPSNWLIPIIVRDSLEEAKKCYSARAFNACAVMCGKALEGLCKLKETKSKDIAGGLKELLDQKVIDERLYEWGETLRIQRNFGAHASEQKISKDDAHDLLDFANAICEYIFVLSDKYEKFIERHPK